MRRLTRKVMLGKTAVGGDSPITVQSMTNTPTRDVERTLGQIKRLEEAGCEIIRLAVPDTESALAIKSLKSGTGVPLVADIHFNYRLALKSIEAGADGIRLNPGNIYRPDEVKEVARSAGERGIPIRVGVNSGSIKKRPGSPGQARAMSESAKEYTALLEGFGFSDIIISLKTSDVVSTIEAYEMMAPSCDYPFHLGITAAGPPDSGVVKSSVGLGVLLYKGIGDTIRISLTGDPEEEVRAGFEILDCLGLREKREPVIISCPTCGRCRVDLVKIVEEAQRKIRRMFPGDELRGIKIAIMGCPVNGPGEAKEADAGIACGRGTGALFRKGRVVKKAPEEEMVGLLMEELAQIAGIERRKSR